MEKPSAYDDLISNQRSERKELQAKVHQMKHAVSKGDKRKKKDVTSEIAQMLCDLDLKHEKELQEFEAQNPPKSSESIENTSDNKQNSSTETNNREILFQDENETNITNNEQPPAGNQKISKAQKRRNKKAQQNRDREEAISQQELTNLSGNRYLESAEMTKKLNERGLTIHEIPSDGHCLYKAIEHQLSVLNLETKGVACLRESTSNYLLTHKDEFGPFITDPNTGDMLNEEQYIKYCDDVKNSSVWGGHVEIQVLASVCGKPIEIIQATGPSIIMGDETETPKLIISYHRHAYGLGEHYNSVIPI